MKRLLVMIISTMSLVVGCSAVNTQSNTTDTSSQNKPIETSQQQSQQDKEEFSKITIVIDPGHSSTGTSSNEPVSPNSSETKLKDGLGATGEYTNIPEHQTNMSVALLLKKELESNGYNAILTKDNVEKSISNIQRAQVGNQNNADLVIRIHADSCESSELSGASMHIPANTKYTSSIYEKSKLYGNKILNTYTKEVGLKNRGVIERDDLTGFNWSKVPVVLIEMGFLSNKQDDEFVSNTKNHLKIAKAIASGVYECF